MIPKMAKTAACGSFTITAGAFIVAAALSVAGCATPLKIEGSADPLAILGPGSIAYARLSGEAARELAPSALPAAAAKALAPVLARTRAAAIGVGTFHSVDSGTPAFQACLIGDYPFRAASLSLGADPAWKREKTGFFNARLGLRAAIPGPNIVVASTGSLEPLIGAAKAPGFSPIPMKLEGFASSEILLWVPEPFSSLASAFIGEGMDLPVLGLLIAADPSEGQPPASGRSYVATIVFLMRDPDSARVYRLAMRLAWFGIAHFLLGEEAEGAIGAAFTLDGDIYRASGVRISGAALERAFGALRESLASARGAGSG